MTGSQPPTVTRTPTSPVGVDTLLEVLGSVQEQVRFADGKAALIAAFHVALFGFMAAQADAIRALAAPERDLAFIFRVVLFAAYGVSTVVAFIYAVRCVIPRVGESAPRCVFHATHVAKTYQRNYNQYCDDVAKMDEAAWTNQIGSQIVENCNIADEKYRLVKWAARWTVVAVALWACMLVAASVTWGAPSSSAAVRRTATAPAAHWPLESAEVADRIS